MEAVSGVVREGARARALGMGGGEAGSGWVGLRWVCASDAGRRRTRGGKAGRRGLRAGSRGVSRTARLASGPVAQTNPCLEAPEFVPDVADVPAGVTLSDPLER